MLAGRPTADDVLEIRLGRPDPRTDLRTFTAPAGRLDRTIVWTLPLDLGGGPLTGTALGQDRGHWQEVLGALPRPRPGSVVRVEVPGGADPATAAAAFRTVSGTVREAGFRVEWGGAPDAHPDALAAAWPGDDAVDIVGVLCPAGGDWSTRVAGPGGLADWSAWAAAHHTRLAVHWRLAPGTSPTDVRDMAGWFDVSAPLLAYETAQVAPGTTPRTLASYRALWAD